MAKGEQRFNPHPVIVAVSDKGALLIADMAVQARINFAVLAVGWVVRPDAREGLRQTAPRFSAQQNIGNGIARLLPRIPRLQYGAGIVDPRHFHRSAGLQHNNGVGVGSQHSAHQFILATGKGDAFQIRAFGIPFARTANEHHGAVGLCRHTRGLRDIFVAQGAANAHAQSGKDQIVSRLVAELDDNLVGLACGQGNFAHDFITALFKEGAPFAPAVPSVGDQVAVDIDLGITRRKDPHTVQA